MVSAVIVHYDRNNSGYGPRVVLPNGETVFGRQVRLLKEAGIKSFQIVAPERDLASLQKQCEVSYLDDVDLDFITAGTDPSPAQALCQARDKITENDIVFTYSSLLFDQDIVSKLVASEGNVIVVDKKRDEFPLKARLGNKHILQMGHELSEIGCFTALPFLKLGKDAAGRWIESILTHQPDLCEEAFFFETETYTFDPLILEHQLVDFFCGNRETDQRLMGRLMKIDGAKQKTIRKKSAILDLGEQMEERKLKRMLLVHDEGYPLLPVETALPHHDAVFIPFVVSEESGYEDLKEAVKRFREHALEGILSVGTKTTIAAAKMIKLMCMEGYTDRALSEPFYSNIPHISIPINGEKDAAGSRVILLKQEETAGVMLKVLVDQPSMRPDVILIDKNLVISKPARKGKKEKKKRKGKKKQGFKARAVNLVKRSIKYLLKPFPKLYRFSALFYKRMLFWWFCIKYDLQNKTVMFQAFHGKQYSCNPKALYEEMLGDSQYESFRYIWVVKNPKKFKFLKKNPNTRIVKYNSREHLLAAARAKYLISNGGLHTAIKPRRGQVYINTWHGKPIKHICADVKFRDARGKDARSNSKLATRFAKQMTYLLSPAPAFTKNMISAFNLAQNHKEHIVVETGYPRNDFLFRFTPQDVLRVKMDLKIPLDKRVILYAPTWRPTRYAKGVGYLYNENAIDFEQLRSELPADCVLLFRAHNYEAKSVDLSGMSDFVYDVTRYPDVNHLYIISDLMISDYSGTIFDYADLKRPIVLYQYDQEEYVNDLAGVYIDLDELPGEVVLKFSDLSKAIIRQLDHFVYDEKYRLFNETYNCLDGADCSARTLARLIPPEQEETAEELAQKERRRKLRNLKVKIKGFLQWSGLYRNENGKRLASFRGKHRGERCFLIGNGPSLTLQDLEAIKDEVTFSCNLIYRVFDRTSWRPTYHCITDRVFSRTVLGEIKENIHGTLFTNHELFSSLKHPPKNMVSTYTLTEDTYFVHGDLLSYYVSSRATVMSYMIELAMYMGFQEIYLIGVDCSNGFVETNGHFISGYENERMLKIERGRAKRLVKGEDKSLEALGDYRVDRAMYAYEVLRKYADRKGIRIYNATRGGHLEAFERVRLEDVL